MLLVPIVVWGAYAVGIPWPEAAPVNAKWETFGEPVDLQSIRSDVRWHHTLVIEETRLQRTSEPSELHKVTGPIVVASVQFDGRPATVYVYPDPTAVEKDRVDEPGGVWPRDTYIDDISFTRIQNVVVVESGWLNRGTLGETLVSMHP